MSGLCPEQMLREALGVFKSRPQWLRRGSWRHREGDILKESVARVYKALTSALDKALYRDCRRLCLRKDPWCKEEKLIIEKGSK